MNELDVLLRDHVTPLLRAEGFRKSAHTYRQTLPNGDSLIIGFRGYPLGTWGSFLVNVAFVPQPVLELHNWGTGSRLDEPTRANWITWGMALHNQAHPTLAWQYDSEDERRQCIDRLVAALPGAVRGLRLLADRDVLLDVIRGPVRPTSADLPTVWRLHGGAVAFHMALLVERGPSEELRPFLDFYATDGYSSYGDWARARLAAGRPLADELATAPQPRTIESYRPLDQALDGALDRFVTPAMAAAGFDRVRGGYERTTPAGDRAAVDIRLSATATEDVLAFSVVTGLDPAPSREFGGGTRGTHAHRFPRNRTVDWLVAELRPTSGLASPVPALAELGLHPWAVPVDRLEDGFHVLALTLAEASAPFLSSMLDRRQLLEFLDDPAHQAYDNAWTPEMRAAMLLLDDAARAGELADRLDAVRRGRGLQHEEFLAWVQRRRPRDRPPT